MLVKMKLPFGRNKEKKNVIVNVNDEVDQKRKEQNINYILQC